MTPKNMLKEYRILATSYTSYNM